MFARVSIDEYGEGRAELGLPPEAGRRLLEAFTDPSDPDDLRSPLPGYVLFDHGWVGIATEPGWISLETPGIDGVYGVSIGPVRPDDGPMLIGVVATFWAEGYGLDYTRPCDRFLLDQTLAVAAALRPLLALAGVESRC